MRRLTSPVFVGRADELRLLTAAVDAMLGRTPRALAIGGEAGVGKSRLIGELARLTGERGGRTLVGGCSELGGGLPLAPFVEALRPLLRSLPEVRVSELLGGPRAELGTLLPGLAPTPTAPAGPAPDRFAQARLFELLLRLIEDLGEDQPLALAIEDLHWADASTRDCFAFLVRNVAPARVLFAATYRSDELHRGHPLRGYLTELERGGWIERMVLERFGLEELREQVSAIRGAAASQATLETLYDRSEGNPFLAEEVLAVLEDGRPGRLPETVRDLLLHRTDALGERTRRVLGVAAVAGRVVDEELLAVVTDDSADELSRLLREAVDHHVLVPESDGGPGGRYAFRHALLREALYDDLLPGERLRLHRRIAEHLEARASLLARGESSPDAALAYHWDRAGQPGRALVAAIRAAEGAASVRAYTDALVHAERALELWDQVPEPPDGVPYDLPTLLQRTAWAASASGRPRRAIALLRHALRSLDSAEEPRRAATLQADLTTECFRAADQQGADEAMEQALRLVPPEPPVAERAYVLNRVVYPLLFASRYDEARRMTEEAVLIAERLGDRSIEGPARDALGVALAFLGRVDEGVENVERSLALARELGDQTLLADAYLDLGIVLEAAGRFDEAVERMYEAIRALRSAGMEHAARASLETDVAEALRRGGRWAESDDLTAGPLGGEATGWDIGNRNAVRARLSIGLGRFDEAREQLTLAGEAFEGMSAAGFAGLLFTGRAELALWEGRLEDARGWVRGGLDRLAQTPDLRWMGELAAVGTRIEADASEVAMLRRRQAEAVVARDTAEHLLAGLRVAADAAIRAGTIFEREVEGYLATATAEVERAKGVPAPGGWRTAADRWRDLGQPYPEAYAEYRTGDALLATGDRADAASALRAATIIAERLRAAPLLREIESLAGRARLVLAPRSPGGGDRMGRTGDARLAADPGLGALTPRELDVLRLVARGWSDGQIAQALFISPKTASVHVSNIKGKLRVDHRLEAAHVAVRLGLVEPA